MSLEVLNGEAFVAGAKVAAVNDDTGCTRSMNTGPKAAILQRESRY
ncbi:MAG: hypothetical protein ABSH01_26855 [Terriglobia bacterium]|jgi:hypothetical protein